MTDMLLAGKKTENKNYSSPEKFMARLGAPLAVSVLMFSALFATTARARTLVDPRPERSSTLFGAALAVVGDLDNDGVPDFAVGAPFQDGDFLGSPGFGAPQNVGKVYVVSGRTLNVITQLDDPKFQMIQNEKFGGQIGTSLAVTADLNGDGSPDILAGVPHHIIKGVGGDENKINAGRAFLFNGKNGNVLLTLDDPDPDENSRLGFAVVALDDVNSDGVPDLLVTAPFKGNADGFAEVGIAYIFSGANGNVIRELTPPSNSSAEGGRFGSAAANIGDINNDGVSDILIGAPGHGRVFVFDGATGALIFNIPSPVAEQEPSFGSAVAGGMDLNGDGIPDFAVGAPLFNNLHGAVFLFNGTDGSKQRTIRSHDRQAFSKFGASILLTNDVGAHGRKNILIGAPDQDVNGLAKAGKVFVFRRGGSFINSITSAAPQAFAGFGYALAAADFDGDGLADPLVGAPFQNLDIVASDGDIEHHLQIGRIELK